MTLQYGLDDTTITTEANHLFDITKSRKKKCLRLNYNESNRFLYANDT